MDSLNWILKLTGSQCSCLSRGSDGEKRGAISTTRAMQFYTRFCHVDINIKTFYHSRHLRLVVTLFGKINATSQIIIY